MRFVRQQIRDPLHNLIEFKANEFENALWDIIQTRPFQRLRGIKQLGFSDLVYPGATHSRFAHSIGVFHTARKLMEIIKNHQQKISEYKESSAQHALAASLVHDLGHGPFSHAFENVGKRLNKISGQEFKLVDHEKVGELLIKDSEVSAVFYKHFGEGYASNVAKVIKTGPGSIYNAVVSSQFDADRLDYMRRDRLMTGTKHAAIDFDWLMTNLQVGKVKTGVDEDELTEQETFILGPKAIYAAEAYVLGLFQLYPTVYFHKTTRGAEKILTELLVRLISLIRDGSLQYTALPANHPLVKFAKEPDKLEHVLALDDAVIYGVLPLLTEAKNPIISTFSKRLWARKLFKCVDVRNNLNGIDKKNIEICCNTIEQKIIAWLETHSKESPRILIDTAEREPYKELQESKGPLNQIQIKTADCSQSDIKKYSQVVAAISTFRLFRLYYDQDDSEAKSFIDQAIIEEKKKMDRTTSKKNDAQKVADLIECAGGTIVGRTRLQKIGFFLELTGLGEGFLFSYRHYGPYCEELADGARQANILGLIKEEEKESSWGGYYSIFTSTSNSKQTPPKNRMDILNILAKHDSIQLELAATAALLAAEGSTNPWEETAERKPEKVNKGRLGKAKELYKKLQKIEVPLPLPAIDHS